MLIRMIAVLLPIVFLCGCPGPEDGRPRGGGAGGDGGNYVGKPIHAPSKIDGTKSLSPLTGTPER